MQKKLTFVTTIVFFFFLLSFNVYGLEVKLNFSSGTQLNENNSLGISGSTYTTDGTYYYLPSNFLSLNGVSNSGYVWRMIYNSAGSNNTYASFYNKYVSFDLGNAVACGNCIEVLFTDLNNSYRFTNNSNIVIKGNGTTTGGNLGLIFADENRKIIGFINMDEAAALGQPQPITYASGLEFTTSTAIYWFKPFDVTTSAGITNLTQNTFRYVGLSGAVAVSPYGARLEYIFLHNLTNGTNELPSLNVTYNISTCFNSSKTNNYIDLNISTNDAEGDTIYYGLFSTELTTENYFQSFDDCEQVIITQPSIWGYLSPILALFNFTETKVYKDCEQTNSFEYINNSVFPYNDNWYISKNALDNTFAFTADENFLYADFYKSNMILNNYVLTSFDYIQYNLTGFTLYYDTYENYIYYYDSQSKPIIILKTVYNLTSENITIYYTRIGNDTFYNTTLIYTDNHKMIYPNSLPAYKFYVEFNFSGSYGNIFIHNLTTTGNKRVSTTRFDIIGNNNFKRMRIREATGNIFQVDKILYYTRYIVYNWTTTKPTNFLLDSFGNKEFFIAVTDEIHLSSNEFNTYTIGFYVPRCEDIYNIPGDVGGLINTIGKSNMAMCGMFSDIYKNINSIDTTYPSYDLNFCTMICWIIFFICILLSSFMATLISYVSKRIDLGFTTFGVSLALTVFIGNKFVDFVTSGLGWLLIVVGFIFGFAIINLIVISMQGNGQSPQG